MYVIAIRTLGKLKEEHGEQSPELSSTYNKFIGTRVVMISIIYTLAIVTAYLIPAYTSNEFIIRGLPLAMLYSASNMFVGIQQLPLQLFWKMKRLSWSLIIARLSQLLILLPAVYLIFRNVDFTAVESGSIMIVAFCVVVFSVVASSIGQNVDVHFKSKGLLPFGVDIDKPFITKILSSNRKYGFSYFFSSFHTLIVLMFLGWFFPTATGFKYVGFWALALSLVEILLIIPSSLGNSLLHKIPNYSLENKKKSLGNLLTLVFRIGGVIALNFAVFSKEIVWIVSSRDFLGTRESLSAR
jgi:O-antigen/teichoic acid export membrane protein